MYGPEFVGQRMKFFRKQRGLMQKEVAEALGCTAGNYSIMEAGKRRVPVETLLNFCRMVGISVLEFVGDEKEEDLPGRKVTLDSVEMEIIETLRRMEPLYKEQMLKHLKIMQNPNIVLKETKAKKKE